MKKNRIGLSALVSLLICESILAQNAPSFEFHTRSRQALDTATNQFVVVEKAVRWEPEKTAIIICDMWDQHWCKGATARVAEMAPRINQVIKEARRRGALIIHAPSSTMPFYADWPQRKRARNAPKSTPPKDVSQWHALNRAKEPALPIDDSDGGCDDTPQCAQDSPWKRQIATIEIAPEDAISDSGEEVYNLLQQYGRDNVIVMGVHENMCVLGRPFSIRQMVTVGKNVLLMRDMTDTMYNSRRAPFVSHFVGTDLVAEHIEKYWCPTVTSADILGGEPFHFKNDRRPKVAFIVGENEYHTWETLPEFARTELAWRGIRSEWINAAPTGGNEFTNWQAVTGADLLVVSARRRTPIVPMMEAIRQHLAAGKPLIGIRTASHAFAAKPPDAQHASWDDFDRAIFGEHYDGHYANELHPTLHAVEGAAGHPILAGVPREFRSGYSLYKSQELGPSTQVLITGTIRVEGRDVTEPVAWINTNANRRVFYTSLGGPDDFKEAGFRRLLLNAVLWSLDQPGRPAPIPAASAKYESDWQPMRVPGAWEDNSKGELRDYDGIAWYRCVAKVPESWRGKPVELWIERVDNAHEAYVNGTKVGGAGSFPPNYQNGDGAANRYKVPATALHVGGDNLIAVRVYDDGGRGGFRGDAPALLTKEDAIKLEGPWHFRTGDDPNWTRAGRESIAAMPQFSQVIDAAGVSGRTYQHQAQENPLSPAESLARFTIADGLEIEQVLTEPIVRQPVALSFDERGRLWVVQYLQYPEPAGLKLMSRDNVWRAVYDKVPPPPPHHFPGADKITIHEDTDGDGIYDKHTTFLEGLNIVTSVARGRGGVWVMNPPYLLFYRDANNDDVPDGDPEVRLSGFGLEDTHSVANSLRWGPDGWLYGCQGSTVTGNIIVYGENGQPSNTKPIFSQGQNIWRYHPDQRRYEIFAEGGGNAFGLEIDSQGRIFSGHNGGNTRGFHYVQGGYLQKGFEKHGPLSNPYAFGYFPPMPHPQAERFTHTFVIYAGGAFPNEDEGKLIGIEPLQGRVVLSDFQADRSSFQTKDLSWPVTTTDQWFRPVDIKLGPDGALYIADWYDRQVNHYRNHEGEIDKNHGRVYRLKAKGAKEPASFNLAQLSDSDLVEKLKSANKWFRQEALRLLYDRKSPALQSTLKELVERSEGQLALESLWALNACGGLDDSASLEFLTHRDGQVRSWTVRLLGDRPTQSLSPTLGEALGRLAQTEPVLEVRCQLASTAKRLAAASAFPIVRALLSHDEDAGDPRLPLLVWWAIEAKADSDADTVLGLLNDRSLWTRPMVLNQILERLMRRYAAPGTRKDLLLCARLLELAPAREPAAKLMSGFELAYKGRPLTGLPDELLDAMNKAGAESLPLALRRGKSDAIQTALRLIGNESEEKNLRIECIQILGEVKQMQSTPALLKLLGSTRDVAICRATLGALLRDDNPEIGRTVIAVLPSLPAEVQTTAFSLLASRPAWALALLETVDGGKIQMSLVPQDALRRIKLYSEPRLTELFEKHWGSAKAPTTGEMREKIRRLAGVLESGSGSPYEGQKVFTVSCAVCHKLFGQGGQVGPDLTTYQRSDIDNMLLNIVNPSAEIREGYENYLLTTTDGRTLGGFLADKDNQVVVLRGLDGENNVVAQSEIASLKSAGVSLMPEGLLDALDEQQVRDLFAYLRSTQPLVR